MDTRSPPLIHSALIFETGSGIPSATAAKELKSYHIKPEVIAGFDPNVAVEDFDVVIGFLPEEKNRAKLRKAAPLAQFLNRKLTPHSRKLSDLKTMFVTSDFGFDAVTETLQKHEAVTDKRRATVNRWAAMHSGWLLAQIAHSADEWEGGLTPLKAQKVDGFQFWDPLRIQVFLKQQLRYGENPHQAAALYVHSQTPKKGASSVAHAEKIQGKELSYNNLNDTDAALELVSEFDPKETSACAIIKHANPCGVALGGSLANAYRKALACDPASAFGGVVAFNKSLDRETTEQLLDIFTEVVIAPGISDEARTLLQKKPNLRVLLTGGLLDPSAKRLMIRSISGGLLVQLTDSSRALGNEVRVVTSRPPSPDELNDLKFAFTVVKHVKSNAIVFAKDRATVGIGAGQMSRVDAARIAAAKAVESAKMANLAEPATIGSVAASDAFFPFPDGLLAIAEAGATSVIQPGGSINDDEVIKAADDAGLGMVFTGVRHFRH